jgi:hypothetical protein
MKGAFATQEMVPKIPDAKLAPKRTGESAVETRARLNRLFRNVPSRRLFFRPMPSQRSPAGMAKNPAAKVLIEKTWPMKSGSKPNPHFKYRLKIAIQMPELRPFSIPETRKSLAFRLKRRILREYRQRGVWERSDLIVILSLFLTSSRIVFLPRAIPSTLR